MRGGLWVALLLFGLRRGKPYLSKADRFRAPARWIDSKTGFQNLKFMSWYIIE